MPKDRFISIDADQNTISVDRFQVRVEHDMATRSIGRVWGYHIIAIEKDCKRVVANFCSGGHMFSSLIACGGADDFGKFIDFPNQDDRHETNVLPLESAGLGR